MAVMLYSAITNFFHQLWIPEYALKCPQEFQAGTPVFSDIKSLSDFPLFGMRQLLNLKTEIVIA